MRLGFSIGSTSAILRPSDLTSLIREAERLGYGSAWVPEVYGEDPISILAWLAAQTSRIALGSGVLQIHARTPVAAAMSALTLDRLSGGRFNLGLGPSGPQVAEGLHGVPYGRPLARTRDYVQVVRQAMAGEVIRYEGATLTLPLPGGEGIATSLAVAPLRHKLPIYLSGIGPAGVRLAGEIADGWLAIHSPPEYVAHHVAKFKEMGGNASLPGFDIAPIILTAVEDDLEAARDLMRPRLAQYLGGMGSRRTNFYNRLAQHLGFAGVARRVQDAYLEGRRDDAMDMLPDALIDAMTMCGPPGRVRERLDAYRDAGAGTLIVSFVIPSLGLQIEQLRLVAELAA